MLGQCGDDLSREHVMHVAAGLRDVDVPVLLPGIRIDGSDYRPVK